MTSSVTAQLYPDDRSWERDADGTIHLLSLRCGDCSTLVFPHLGRCPGCLGTDLQPHRLSRTGTVYSFTTIHTAGPGFAPPYTVGFVDLPEQVRVFAQLRGDTGRLRIGSTATADVDQIRTAPDGSPVISYVFRVVN